MPPIGPNGETLVELLRAPARAHPTSLAGQLRYVRDNWGDLLGDALDDLLARMLLAIDVITQEERGLHLRFGGGGDGGAGAFGGGGEAPSLVGLDAEPERFSSDSAWMPRLVLIAKSTHVWLDQLSRRHGTEIRTLDAIPDEELDRLARWGITGLWLIGLWERSKASQRIKVWRGNPDAAASAYSLDDYVIAWDLGGEEAWANLRGRAWQRGIRLASDMVPNHMGIDSRWVIDHPEWFLQTSEPPYPGYAFNGENVAEHERVEIRLEDHYWDNSDAAVVFERRDRSSGERRYVYHGNDGTSFPWNDTAQLDFSQAAVREQVIQTILAVARRFPVIRFDAAMVLAKRHVRRLWFPAPGQGGEAIPSRAEFGSMTDAEFEAAMPQEFWREVVDRVAAEVPDTLLLAEAFWMLEGYFVRTLGMHRVYNSAFMHMLRDEDNAGYRRVLKETLEFDPEILKRYVNFMNNPDEKTAVEQFGKGDKYIGVATLLATLPGLPMFGHGQFEGFAEKYGMEFRRATMQEHVDEWLIARHEREIVPLLHRRGDFAEAHDFLLFDVAGDGGGVDEHVFAYSNGSGQARSLVVYHNRYAETSGWVRESAAYAAKEGDGSKRLVRRTLADGLGIGDGSADDRWLVFREQRSGLEHLRSVAELRERGLHVQLHAYETLVFWEMRELYDSTGVWRRLAERLGGSRRRLARGRAPRAPALAGPRCAAGRDRGPRAADGRAVRGRGGRCDRDVGRRCGPRDRGRGRRAGRPSLPVVDTIDEPSQAAALRVWALLSPLGIAGPRRTARSDEPGLVRGAAPGAASSPTRCAPVASTRRRRGRPPSGCTSSWTCRSPRSWTGRATVAPRGSWRPGWTIRSSAPSSGSTRGTASSGSTASRGTSSWRGRTAWSGCSPRPTSARSGPVERSAVSRTLTEAGEASRLPRRRAAGRAGRRRRGARCCVHAAAAEDDRPAQGTETAAVGRLIHGGRWCRAVTGFARQRSLRCRSDTGSTRIRRATDRRPSCWCRLGTNGSPQCPFRCGCGTTRGIPEGRGACSHPPSSAVSTGRTGARPCTPGSSPSTCSASSSFWPATASRCSSPSASGGEEIATSPR